MTDQQKIIKNKLGLLNLAKELGDISFEEPGSSGDRGSGGGDGH